MNNSTGSPPSMPSSAATPVPGAVKLFFDESGTLTDRATGVSCPVCQTELRIGAVGGCQFAGCSSCKGMLFQQEVFASLVRHLRAMKPDPQNIPMPLDPKQLNVRRLCPTCAQTFDTHAYGGPGNAVIDTCFQCGVIWFDQGEFTKLVDAPGKR